tara:strand:+ start:543 stop:1820 length:1278 start_codon:yes stop_codon:yes gene_type:complete
MNNKLHVAIIAGGLGKRLQKIQKKPKILTNFSNTNILNIIRKNLKKNNLKNINILCGKNTEEISKTLNKSNNIKLYQENRLLGTAGCLTKLEYKNLSKDILIIFGDLLFNIDFKKFFYFHKNNGSDLTIFTHPSDHLFDSDIIDTDEKNIVRNIFLKPHKKKIITKNITIAGIFIIKKKLLKEIPKNKKYDFSKNFIKNIINKKFKVMSYNSREYCKDFGTPKRLKRVRVDFINSKHKYLHNKNKIPAIFLDRDGVINKDQGPLKYSNPMNFFNNSLKALIKLRKSEYLIFLITNQSGVAKGFISLNKLINSFKKYEMHLSKKNFYFDKIYFCPHYPIKGYRGENKKFKIKCNCRKPKPGLIFKAKNEFNIDLSKSYFVGDSITDHQAARRAKVKSILLNKVFANKRNYIYKRDILAATNYILKQ